MGKKPAATKHATVHEPAQDQPPSLADIAEMLLALPKKEKPVKVMTKYAVISRLKPQLEAARQKGYDWSELKSMLEDQGIILTVNTLKAYMTDQSRAARYRSGDTRETDVADLLERPTKVRARAASNHSKRPSTQQRKKR